jgi:hypothetical protein
MALTTFKSADQIKAVPGFKPDNPVSIDKFLKFLGYYTLKPALKCCVAEKAGLCRQTHNNGWVVALKDGSASIIGIDCAKIKFDADESFRSQRVMAERTRQQDDIHRALGGLLVNKEHDLKRLRSTSTALDQLAEASSTISAALGDSLVLALLNLDHRSRGSVQLMTYEEQPFFNKVTNKPDFRDVRTSREIGRIRVPEAFSNAPISNLRNILAAAELTYSSIEKLDKKPTPKLATHFSRTINAVYPASLRIAELNKQIGSFLKGQLELLYFVAPTGKDKIRAAQFIAYRQGNSISQTEAQRAVQIAMARIRQEAGIRSRPHEVEEEDW